MRSRTGSEQHTTIDLDAPRPAPPDTTSSDRLRTHLLAGATVLAPVLMVLGLLLEVDEGPDDASGRVALDAIAANGPDRLWTSYFLAAIGLALLGAAGLVVMRLVRDRGGALATAGGLLALVSGAAAAAGIFMYGTAMSVMSDPDLDREAMGALQDAFEDAWQTAPAFAIGFGGMLLSILLMAGALLRSRVVPVWVPAAMAVSAVAFFFLAGNGPVTALTLLPLLAAYAGLAQRLERST